MRSRITFVLLLALATLAGTARGQGLDEARRSLMTRAELEQLLADLEETTESPVYSSRTREHAAREARMVRRRLEQGDLQVGDRVLLVVERQPALTDTFSVVAGRVLDLPVVGLVELDGVLRSELEDKLKEEISVYFRDPQIRARSLIRTSVLGAVGAPGFYTLPSDILFGDAVMAAGGLNPAADVDDARIVRGGDIVWEGEAFQEAIREGRTLDQLSVRAGDQIVIPEQSPPGAFDTAVRTVSLILGIPLTIFAITQIF